MSSILTVSQLNRYLAFKIKSDVKLKGVAVKGELSNFSVNYRSGHAYFSLKDDEAVIKGIMFSSNVSRLRFAPESGMSVLVTGDVCVYERDGILQITASELTPIGTGGIRLGLEQLKRKLSEQGVFDTAAKKKIPVLPKKIAVVTSLTGAALQDILNILGRRCPIVRVEIFPAQVQGEAAPDSVAAALARADKSGADTLILARGGGSDEDLMPFNSEKVALAVHKCSAPVISAVGHETDTTLADYAADLRAPTPSAAAELVVPMISQLIGTAELLQRRLDRAFSDLVASRNRELSELSARLRLLSPQSGIAREKERLASLSARLNVAAEKKIEKSSMLIDRYSAQLSALSPYNILDRGYAMVMKNGTVTGPEGLVPGDEITIRFAEGTASAEVKQVNKNDI